MNGLVVLAERLLEAVEPHAVQPAEPFTDETVESGIRPFLRATLDDHLDQFNLTRSLQEDGLAD